MLNSLSTIRFQIKLKPLSIRMH